MVETRLGFKTFGGFGFVSRAMLGGCYTRMAAWVRLVSTSIAAEFPSWEVLQAFGVFGLSAAPSELFVKESLARLSHSFGLSEAALTSEFVDFQRFAKSAFDKSSVDELATYTAWVGSLSRVRKRSVQRKSSPSDIWPSSWRGTGRSMGRLPQAWSGLLQWATSNLGSTAKA